MNEEDVAVKLTALEHEAKSAKHRLDELEIQSQAIQDLAMSVKEMSINMSAQLEEQKRQGDDIEKLKAEPADNWKRVKQKIIDTAIGIVVGGFVTGAILMIAQNI